jgi:hypothetical protein
LSLGATVVVTGRTLETTCIESLGAEVEKMRSTAMAEPNKFTYQDKRI